MLRHFKHLFHKESEEKSIVICIHGFGIRRSHEYDNFKLWGKEDFNFHTFDIYVYENENDNNPDVWIKRCEHVIESFLQKEYHISLIGFSMGGVIASYLANKYKVDRLFMIAPAFEYFTMNNVINKTKEAIIKEESDKPVLPPQFTSCFIEVVKRCRESIKEVSCPICIVHGNSDEVVPYKSSIKIMNDINHDKKRLFIIHGGEHRMMMQKNCGFEVYQIFKLFMNNQILPDEETIFVKDILEK